MDKERVIAESVEAGGVAAAASLSLIPVAGGAAAVVAQYFANIPAKRRLERILGDLQAELTRAFDLLDEVDERVLDSEPFNAAVLRVVRESLETGSDSKRRWLRHALVNGYVKQGAEERDRFLALVSSYEPWHVQVLSALSDIMADRDSWLDHAVESIDRKLDNALDGPTVRRALRDLTTDGLVAERNLGVVREIFVGAPPRARKEQVLSEDLHHAITSRGSAFLAFIASPFGDGEPEPEGAP